MKRFIVQFLQKYNIFVRITNPRPMIRAVKQKFGDSQIKGIEIGVWKGDNALSICKCLNVQRLYLIDPFKLYNEYKKDTGSWMVLKSFNQNKNEAVSKLSNYLEITSFIEELSSTAFKDIKEKVNFVYIDGNHRYEYVKKDIQLYWNKLKKGGFIGGHDIEQIEVLRAVYEFAYERKATLHIIAPDWWIIKGE